MACFFKEKITLKHLNTVRSYDPRVHLLNENRENVPHLEITEVVLVHCNIVNDDYQVDSTVLNTFVPNKSFCQLLGTSQLLELLMQSLHILKYGLLVRILNR